MPDSGYVRIKSVRYYITGLMFIILLLVAYLFHNQQDNNRKFQRVATETKRQALLNCKEIEKVKTYARGTAERGMKSLRTIEYYKTHPEELARAIEANQIVLDDFSADPCPRRTVVNQNKFEKKTGATVVVGVPYTCSGPVHNLIVRGRGSNRIALINLKAGCTGDMKFDITITSNGGDGVKVQGGAHDLKIGPSKIVCEKGVNSSFHQDGVQVQGGRNVTFTGLTIICPYVYGQGAAGFYIDGKDFSGIRNVVCDQCNLEHYHYGAMFTGPAPGSGVRNSKIHQGLLTKGYYAFPRGGSGSVDVNNRRVPACNGTDKPC